MKKICFSLFISLIFSHIAFSQSQSSWVKMLDDTTKNFTQIQESFENEWKGKAVSKGQGYKQFKRLEAFAAPRIYPGDKLSTLSNTYFEYQNFRKTHPIIQSKSNHNWQQIGPAVVPTDGGGSGRLTFLRFDPLNPSIYYAGTPNGGLWKSINNGLSWSHTNDFLSVIGCSDLAIHPTNTNIMYLATGDNDHVSTYSIGVLKSVDGGANWSNTGLTFPVTSGIRIFKMEMSPVDPNILIAVTTSGIRRTTDGGTTWTQVSAGNYRDLEVSPSNSNIWYAATTTQVKRSDNAGATWTTITAGLPTSNLSRLALAVSPNQGGSVWVLAAQSGYDMEGVYRSTDSGVNFTQITDGSVNMLSYAADGIETGGQSWYDLAIGVNPLNANEIWIGGVNTWKTTNGGAQWNLASHWYGGGGAPYVHADVHDIKFYPNSNNLAIICDGGLFNTVNGGNSFTDLSSNLCISQQYQISQASYTENLLLTGHQDNGTNRFSGSNQWKQVFGGDGMSCLIDWNDNSRMIASYQYGNHFSSIDGGDFFDYIFSGLDDGTWISSIHQDPINPDLIYACGRDRLIVSDNFGFSYTEKFTSESTDIVEMAICKSIPSTFYLLQGTGAVAKIFKTTNGGNSFTNVTSNLPSSSSKVNLAVDPNNPEQVFVTYSGFNAGTKVYKSVNGGSSWTNISAGLPNVPVNVMLIQNNTDQNIYVGNDFGVFYRDSIENIWIEFSDSLPRTEVTDLDFYYPTNQLIAGTYGRGTWKVKSKNDSQTTPVASFNVSNSVICLNETVQYTSTSSNAPSQYNWTFQGGNPASSIAQNPSVTYNSPGAFDVQLIVSNSYGVDTTNSTSYMSVQDCAGIEELELGYVRIFPNPAKQFVKIESKLPVSEIQLLDIQGKVMFVKITEDTLGSITVEWQKLSAGLYTLQYKTTLGMQSKSLVVE